jgi:aldehyde dehydrogenase (NAD+)
VEVVQGGVDVSQDLLAQRWDYIFFTGSVAVGKKSCTSGSKTSYPVTLELGGKTLY